MTDQEKNEVLAKWAGFAKIGYQNTPDWILADRWVYPNTDRRADLPDFLHSLDAQAKWLLPKLRGYHITRDALTGGATEVTVWGETCIGTSCKAPTPAEACAEAILSLIEKHDGSWNGRVKER